MFSKVHSISSPVASPTSPSPASSPASSPAGTAIDVETYLRTLPRTDRPAQLEQWAQVFELGAQRVRLAPKGQARDQAFADLRTLDKNFRAIAEDKKLFAEGTQDERAALLTFRNAFAKNQALIGNTTQAVGAFRENRTLAQGLNDPEERATAEFKATTAQFLASAVLVSKGKADYSELKTLRSDAEKLIPKVGADQQTFAKTSAATLIATEAEILTNQHRTVEARALALYAKKTYEKPVAELREQFDEYFKAQSQAAKTAAALKNGANALARPEGQDYIKALNENVPGTLTAGVLAGAAVGGFFGSIAGPPGTIGGAALGAEISTGVVTVGALTGALVGFFGGASSQSLGRRWNDVSDGAKTGISPHNGFTENALNFIGAIDSMLPAGGVYVAGRALIAKTLRREVLDEGLSALVLRGVLDPVTEKFTTTAGQAAERTFFHIQEKELQSFKNDPRKVSELRRLFGSGTDEFLELLNTATKIPVRKIGEREIQAIAELAHSRATGRAMLRLGLGDVAARLGLQGFSAAEQWANSDRQIAPSDVLRAEKNQILRSVALGAAATTLPLAVSQIAQRHARLPLRNTIKLPHPEELAQEAFEKRWKSLDLPEHLAAQHFPGVPHDPVSGVALPIYRTSTLERAINHVALTGAPAVGVSGEMRNLGGANKLFGHSGANRILGDIASVFREAPRSVEERVAGDALAHELQSLGGTLMAFRLNGPRFHAIISGVSAAEVKQAAERAMARVNGDLKLQGLGGVPHPKGELPGVSLNLGVAEIKATDNVRTAFQRSDNALSQQIAKEARELRRTGVVPSGDAPPPLEPARSFNVATPELPPLATLQTMDLREIVDPWKRTVNNFTAQVKTSTGRELSRFEAEYLLGARPEQVIPNDMIDDLTKLYTSRQEIQTMLILQKLQKEIGSPAVIGAVDVSNLGAFSKADGNRILMKTAQLLRKHFPELPDATEISVLMRVGGDELGTAHLGLTEQMVAKRYQLISNEFDQWASTQKVTIDGKQVPMMSVPHTKTGRDPGVRIDFAVTRLHENEPLLRSLEDLDNQIDVSRIRRVRLR